MPTLAVRVQEKGQVTIPLEIRKRLGLKKGDLVTFVETDAGVLMQPAEVVVNTVLDAIGQELQKKGVTLEQLLKRGREIRGEVLREKYGLTDSEIE